MTLQALALLAGVNAIVHPSWMAAVLVVLSITGLWREEKQYVDAGRSAEADESFLNHPSQFNEDDPDWGSL